MRFEGKTAIVTGGAGHLGYAMVERLAGEGAEVAVWDNAPHTEATVAKLKQKNLNVFPIVADVSKRADVDATFTTLREQWDKLDIVVNNAGLPGPGINFEFNDFTDDIYDRVMDVNVRSVYMIGQAAARWMVDKKVKGSIINISSLNAIMLDPVQALYGASKGAVLTLTQGMAVSLGKYGIRVNAIGPAGFPQPWEQLADTEYARRERVLTRAPLERFGSPPEVAGAVAYFASDDSSYVTGQILYVDGGRMALSTNVPVADPAGAIKRSQISSR